MDRSRYGGGVNKLESFPSSRKRISRSRVSDNGTCAAEIVLHLFLQAGRSETEVILLSELQVSVHFGDPSPHSGF